MNILLVTTISGESLLNEVLKNFRFRKHAFRVFRSEAQVACLINTETLLREMLESNIRFKEYDLIILPGLVRGSASVISKAIGVPTVKGTIYVGDLPEMIKYLDRGVEFSPELPADVIIRRELNLSLSLRVREMIKSKEAFFKLSTVKVPLRPPPLILLYEHVLSNSGNNTPGGELPLKRLRNHGFEGVILGFESERIDYKSFHHYVELLRENRFLVGVDAPNYGGLSKDVFSRVDLVMNIDLGSLQYVSKYLREGAGIVVIPQNLKDLNSSIKNLKETVSEALQLGIRKIIIDPLLRPPLLGLAESLVRFRSSIENINFPHLFGMPNIYELVDADTAGSIALLTSLAYELGASALLVTESSNKAKGAIKESSISREITYRASIRKSPPINVGIDLLVIKDKKDIHVKPPPLESKVPVAEVKGFVPIHLEGGVYLKIYVDMKANDVVVDVHSSRTHEVIKRYRGNEVLSLGRELIREQKLSPEHSLYLGFELSKAAIALQLQKSYVQDAPIFKFRYD